MSNLMKNNKTLTDLGYEISDKYYRKIDTNVFDYDNFKEFKKNRTKFSSKFINLLNFLTNYSFLKRTWIDILHTRFLKEDVLKKVNIKLKSLDICDKNSNFSLVILTEHKNLTIKLIDNKVYDFCTKDEDFDNQDYKDLTIPNKLINYFWFEDDIGEKITIYKSSFINDKMLSIKPDFISYIYDMIELSDFKETIDYLRDNKIKIKNTWIGDSY